MFKPVAKLALLLAPLSVLVRPAYPTIYVWTDGAGVTNVTDDRRRVPSGVRVRTVEVRTHQGDASTLVAQTPSSATESPAPRSEAPVADAKAVTQGAFAVQLAAELGSGDGLTPQAAAARLSAVGIAPRLRNWELDAPMTRALLDRLSRLTVAAADAGRIPIEPEDARFAFDSAAALAGISNYPGSTVAVPAPPPHTIEVVPVPVYAPRQILDGRVVLVGTRLGHGRLHIRRPGVLHNRHPVEPPRRRHQFKDAHRPGAHPKREVRSHWYRKHSRQRARARFKQRFDAGGSAHTRALRGGAKRRSISVRRSVGSFHTRLPNGHRMGIGWRRGSHLR